MHPKFFYYQNNLYLKVTPSKSLFKSTMVHEVINRGDVFAVHMETGLLTIVPGKADVTIPTDKELDYKLPPYNIGFLC